MRALHACYVLLMFCTGCARQPLLPSDSKYNVTASLNDSTWYGTGRVLRLRRSGESPEKIRRFNLLVFTDIDYQGMSSGPNPNTENGCLDENCTMTQALAIFNIPLKRGKYHIAKLDRYGRADKEFASLSYIGNAGGLVKEYSHQKAKPAWVKISGFNRTTGTVDGAFKILFSDNRRVNDNKRLPATAIFSNGLFRIRITDVVVK